MVDTNPKQRFSVAFNKEAARRNDVGEPRLTKTEVWKAAGATSGAFTQWMNGVGIKLEKAILVAPLLKCDPYWLANIRRPHNEKPIVIANYPNAAKSLEKVIENHIQNDMRVLVLLERNSALRNKVVSNHNGQCMACMGVFDPKDMVMQNIHPISDMGVASPEDFTLICKSCHSALQKDRRDKAPSKREKEHS